MIIPQTALIGIASAALISFVAPFAVYFACSKRMILPARNILLGIVAFILFALVLEGAMHWYFLKLNPVTSAWLKSSTWGFVVYGAGAAALFEETGRFLAMRFFVKRTGDAGTAVAYGIGHGGAEALIVGALAQMQILTFAVMQNAGALDVILGKKVPPAALAKLHEALAHLNFMTALVGGIERISALLIQVALSLLVWRAVSRRQSRWFFAALAAHAGVDSVAALFQKGQVSLFATESFVAAVGVSLLIFFLIKLPRKEIAA